MRVLVVGGGLSGLATAYYLNTLGKHIHVTLIEKSHRIGGWIQSTLFNNKWLFEQGPRAFVPRKGQHTVDIIQQLGLQQHITLPTKHAAKRFIYLNKQLHKLPQTPTEFITSPLMKGVLSEAMHETMAPVGAFDTEYAVDFDESIQDFSLRRFGPNVANKLIDPLVAGIYSGNPKKLSIRSCFPDLLDLELAHGSVIKGVVKKMFQPRNEESHLFQSLKNFPLYSFKHGVSTLTEELHSYIKKQGVDVRLNTELRKVSRQDPSIKLKSEFKCSQSDEISSEDFDHIIFTVDAKSLSRILSSNPIFDQVRSELDQIRFASLAIVNVGFEKRVIREQGFGFLVPSSEKDVQVLGVTYDSETFPEQLQPKESTRLTVMLGGDRNPSLLQEKSLAEIEDIALRSLSLVCGINVKPDFVYADVKRDCIAQYDVGHSRLLRRLEVSLNRSGFGDQLSVIGASFYGPAMNACISHARSTCKGLLDRWCV